jgi:serine/threonine protein kinase
LDNRLFDSDITLSEQQKISLIKGIARGLYHLHSNNIVHRDLAARNVLVRLPTNDTSHIIVRLLTKTIHLPNSSTSQAPLRYL